MVSFFITSLFSLVLLQFYVDEVRQTRLFTTFLLDGIAFSPLDSALRREAIWLARDVFEPALRYWLGMGRTEGKEKRTDRGREGEWERRVEKLARGQGLPFLRRLDVDG